MPFRAQLFWGLPRQELVRCSHWRGVARIIDTWAFVFVVLNNVLATSAVLHRATKTSARMILPPAVFFIGWSFLQRYVSRRWPDFYYKNHTWVLLHNRLMRCPMMPILIHETRTRCRDPALPTQLELYLSTGRPFATPPIELFTSALAISGSLLLLMHATAAPLPFLPHLALQATCVTLMLLCQSLPAAYFIQTSPLRPTGHAACLRLNALLENSSSLFGVYSNRQLLRATCDHHSSQLLVTFAQLYFGGVLPICFSFRLQSYLHQYLSAVSQEGTTAGSRSAGTSRMAATAGLVSSSRGGGPGSPGSSSRRSSSGVDYIGSGGSGGGYTLGGAFGQAGGSYSLMGCPSASSRRGSNGGSGTSSVPGSPAFSDAWSVGGGGGGSRGTVSGFHDGTGLPDPTGDAPAPEDALAGGWPHQADTLPGMLADLLVLAYMVPICWVAAMLLRPVLSAVGWHVAPVGM